MIDPTNPDTSIQAGDLVRSHDFPWNHDDPSRPACFMEGIVVDVLPAGESFSVGEESVRFHDCDRYIIRTTRQVFSGDEMEPSAPCVFPPVNGTPSLFGLGADQTFGVEKIQEAVEA